MNINIITLGCSKNLVDSEYLLQQFRANGHKVFHDNYDIESDIVILNTCGFILDAKQESIDTILHYVERKKKGLAGKIFVMGCLSERYRAELARELPEVDGFFGVWDQERIVKVAGSKYYPEYLNDRLVTTPSHYAFLKISEGCDRSCSFCAIPGIRGKQRSRTVADLSDEAANLVTQGVRELLLIAQDLSSYGKDLAGKKALPELLSGLLRVDGLDWIRMHYAYPTGFPMEAIEMMAGEKRICNYMDIPIQHINDRILTSMNRGHDRKKLETLLTAIRNKVPDVALRTTVMVGYPGETENEFRELCDFIGNFRFERLGVFPYSHEDQTFAGNTLADDVPAAVKEERASHIMKIQQEISLELNQAKLGKEFSVLIDETGEDYYIGRSEYDSPEVDNNILIPVRQKLEKGNFYRVRITDAREFDLYGEVV